MNTKHSTETKQPTMTIRDAGTVAPSPNPIHHFNGEVKLGDLLTTFSIFLALLAGVTGWVKDRKLRRREYADRVRAAAAKAAVALARREEIALWLFDAIQVPITEADEAAVAGTNIMEVRDRLWKAIVSLRAEVGKRLLDEKLAEAYVALYAYDTRIQERYTKSAAAINEVDDREYRTLLSELQDAMFKLADSKQTFESADLGNSLRLVVATVRLGVEVDMGTVVDDFQASIARLIRHSDRALLKGKYEV